MNAHDLGIRLLGAANPKATVALSVENFTYAEIVGSDEGVVYVGDDNCFLLSIDPNSELAQFLEKAELPNDQLLNAARVILLTPHIREYLEAKDPKALEQLERACS